MQAGGKGGGMLNEQLREWEERMRAFTLPDWESLPELELYMDQVVLLLSRYLSFPPLGESGEDKVITASIVNNYVRMKVMPPPVKKKYGRVHIAYLLMICTLKQSLSIASIQRLLPMGLPEAEVERIYTRFVRLFREAQTAFSKYSEMILPDTPEDDSLVIFAAVVSNLAKALTEALLVSAVERKNEGK